jgi:hypothetical protein
MPGHVHFDLTAPFDAELTGPIVVPFSVTSFMADALLVIDALEGARDVVWDATGTSTPPLLRGSVADPNARVWTGHLTLDPTLPTRWHTDHGWWAPLLIVTEYLDSGDVITLQMIPGFHVILDASAPDTGGSPFMSSLCAPAPPAVDGIRWGSNLVQTSEILPIGPLSSALHPYIVTQGYGTVGLSPATFQQRLDLDLHHGIPGTILFELTQDGDFNTPITIDPAILMTGPHKMALFRNQHTLDNQEEVDTLLVFTVRAADGVPPPTTCTDPLALNNGGPLPCVYPTVPPPPIWTIGTVFSTPTPTGLHFELCAALNPNDATACHAVP